MTKTWTEIVSAVAKLPGIGPKMAERLALHLIRKTEDTDRLLEAIRLARENLRRCPRCGDFMETPETTDEPCGHCQDDRRDGRAVCVVEEVGDLHALEKSRAFHGRYHVLGGVLSALDGVGPQDLRIQELLDRVKKEGFSEVIIATNPTAEGETTATYLADLLKGNPVSVSRLAYGLPSGSAIQYADEFTLARALEGRRSLASPSPE